MRILCVADFAEIYNRNNLHGAAAYAKRAGWELREHHVAHRENMFHAIRDADALLLGTHNFESDTQLTRTALPTVSWSATLSEVSWPRVLPDDLKVGRVGAEHLLSLGLKRFAFFSDVEGIWVERRREGFAACIEAAGFPVITGPADKSLASPQRTVEWVKSLPRPVGVMLVHDPAAVNVVAACRTLGLRIPEDVALVGVNDDERTRDVVNPPLSSVPLPNYQIGYEAAALLSRVMDRSTRTPWSILVPIGELIARQSSDVLGSSESEVARAVRFIREHLAEGVETKQVVAHIGTCRATLNTKFSQALDRSVSEEIRRARIERCRQLLSTTDWPMTVIAEKAGFSSARQLSETFGRVVGMTPLNFRAQFKPATHPA